MTAKDIFHCQSTQEFLVAVLGGPGRRTGQRSRAAEAIGCHLSYLSQILRGDAHLSPDQAFRLGRHLGLSADEREMLLLLAQKERAGAPELKAHYDERIAAIKAARLLIKNRLKTETELGPDDAAIYYGSWIYACLHVIVMIPDDRTRDLILSQLGVESEAVQSALEFLESRGLVARDSDGRYHAGPSSIHLPETSPNIRKHHANWRLKALQSLDRKARPNEIHFASISTLSRADAMEIKERILKLIETSAKTIAASPEEAVHCMTIDWFEIP